MSASFLDLDLAPISNDNSQEELGGAIKELRKIIIDRVSKKGRNIWLLDHEDIEDSFIVLDNESGSISIVKYTSIYLDERRQDLMEQLILGIKNKFLDNEIVKSQFENLKKITITDIERDDVIHTVFNEITSICKLILIVKNFDAISNFINGNDCNWLLRLSTDFSNAVSFIIVSKSNVESTSPVMSRFFETFNIDLTNSKYQHKNIINQKIQPMVRKDIKLFISYSHKDEEYMRELSAHLSGVKRSGMIKEWHDQKIIPGKEWDKEIRANLLQSQVVIFLISSNFMDSDYINNVEFKATVERYHKNEVCILPVIIRDCDLEYLELSKFKALPKDAKPINQWEDRDTAWVDVVNGLKQVIASMDFGSLDDTKSNFSSPSIIENKRSRKVTQTGEKSVYIEYSGDIIIN